jgi:hypothetical protein
VGLPGEFEGLLGCGYSCREWPEGKRGLGEIFGKIMPLSGIWPSPSLSFPLLFSKPRLGWVQERGGRPDGER